MAKFDLAAKLREAATNLNTPGAEQIEYIPFELLDPDPDNFYSIDGLSELADSIATVGILTPLRVRANGERYTITSGHRRRAAVKLLIDSGEDWSRGLPCIVDRGESTPEWEELKLIFANRQRVKTSAELSREAERTDELFCALKEKGYDFPGRMQEHVAQALGVKASKLKRLHAIRANADEYVLNAYDTGRLNENTAYLLSQHPQEYQHMIWVEYARAGQPQERLTGDVAATIRSAELLMENHKCPLSPGICSVRGSRFSEGLRRRFEGSKVGNCQKGGCCKGCPALLECEAYCFKCKAERQRKEAEQASRRAELEKIHQEAEAQRTQAAEAVPSPIPDGYTQTGLLFDRVQRIRRAAEASGADLRHVFSMRSLSERDLETYLSIINGGPDPTHELDELFDDTEELADLADDLECSTDFLLGRTEAPGVNREPVMLSGGGAGVETSEKDPSTAPLRGSAQDDKQAETPARWGTGTPTEEGWYACLGSWKEIPERTIAYFWDGGWYESKRKIRVMAETVVTAFYRLPDLEE